MYIKSRLFQVLFFALAVHVAYGSNVTIGSCCGVDCDAEREIVPRGIGVAEIARQRVPERQFSPRIRNHSGTRDIGRFNAEVARERMRTRHFEPSPQHAYLLFNRPVTRVMMDSVENAGDLDIHHLTSSYRVDEKRRTPVFLVYCRNGIDHSLSLLAESRYGSIVHNIVPVEPDDKITRKIFEQRGFHEHEMTENGRVFASVFFYRNTLPALADSLINVWCDSIVEYNPNRLIYTVAATPSNLLELSKIKVVERVM